METSQKKKIQEKDIEKILQKCVQCGSCLSVCPIFKAIPQEKFTPRSKLYYMQQSKNIEENSGLEKSYVDVLFKCTACGLCNDICKSDVNLLDIFYSEKSQHADDIPEFNALREKTKQTGNIFGMDNSMRSILWLDDAEDEVREDFEEVRIYENGKTASVCLFLGCLTSYKSTLLKSLISTLKILERFDVDYLVLGESEYCCGHPYTLIGKDSEAEKLRKQNSEIFRKGRFETIITNCPGCLASITKYHALDKNVEVLHLTEFLNKLIKSEDIKNPLHDKIIFHYPCELYVVDGVRDAPVELLRKLGLKVRRLELSCCGGGGVLRVNDPKLSDNILQNKIQEQKIDPDKGVITCCPSCVEQFNYGNVTVHDVSEYVEKATRSVEEINVPD